MNKKNQKPRYMDIVGGKRAKGSIAQGGQGAYVAQPAAGDSSTQMDAMGAAAHRGRVSASRQGTMGAAAQQSRTGGMRQAVMQKRPLSAARSVTPAARGASPVMRRPAAPRIVQTTSVQAIRANEQGVEAFEFGVIEDLSPVVKPEPPMIPSSRPAARSATEARSSASVARSSAVSGPSSAVARPSAAAQSAMRSSVPAVRSTAAARMSAPAARPAASVITSSVQPAFAQAPAKAIPRSNSQQPMFAKKVDSATEEARSQFMAKPEPLSRQLREKERDDDYLRNVNAGDTEITGKKDSALRFGRKTRGATTAKAASAPVKSPFLSSVSVPKRPLSASAPTGTNAAPAPSHTGSPYASESERPEKKRRNIPFVVIIILSVLLGVSLGALVYFVLPH